MGMIHWMAEGHFGIMVHYLKHIMPREGDQISDWNVMVDSFPVHEFCKEIEATGAKWIIFPIGQNNGYYCSPNAYLEKLVPERCSRRDLLNEIAQELKNKGIRFITYLPSEVDSNDEEIRNSFGWDLHPKDKSVFQQRYMKLTEEWSLNMGDLIDGWWFDGCYEASEKSFLRTREWSNQRFDYSQWSKAAKAGNKEAIIAMCPGANSMKYVFKEQEYLAGEANDLNHFPGEEIHEVEMQWHALLWLDCFWIHAEKPGLIVPPRFSDDELYTYIKNCNDHGGAVTLNVGIYQDGSLAEKTMEQIKRIHSRLKLS